jgi:hypothetical protein
MITQIAHHNLFHPSASTTIEKSQHYRFNGMLSHNESDHQNLTLGKTVYER